MEDEAIIKGLSIKKTAAYFLHLLPVDLLREGEWKKKTEVFFKMERKCMYYSVF